MTGSSRAILWAVVALCFGAVPRGVLAEPPAAQAEAGMHFQRGKAAFADGDFETARQAYRAAWQLQQSFDVAANLGQTELRLGRHRDAAEHLGFALSHLPPSVDEATREQMEAMYERAREQVATLRVTVTPDGSELLIDGQVVGTTPLVGLVFVDPGRRVIQARLAGHVAVEREVATRRGEEHEITLALKPRASAATQSQGADAAPATGDQHVGPDDSSPMSWVPVAVGGTLTAIGLAGGIGFAIAADDKRTDRDAQLESLSGPAPCGTGASFASECAAIDDLDRDSLTYQDLSTAGFVTAGIAAVATVAYVLWPREQPGERAVRVAPAFGKSGGSMIVWGAF